MARETWENDRKKQKIFISSQYPLVLGISTFMSEKENNYSCLIHLCIVVVKSLYIINTSVVTNIYILKTLVSRTS